jgi:hypothetical protein
MRALLLPLVALMVLLPRTSAADLALRACMDRAPVLARAMLEADVILLARIDSLDEKQQPTAHGWHYRWTTEVKIEAVWRGHRPAVTRFDASCSGLHHSSRNHCARPPALKGERVVLFLKKGQDGRLHLAQPAFGVFGACPDAGLVVRAKRQDARLFQRILDATR